VLTHGRMVGAGGARGPLLASREAGGAWLVGVRRRRQHNLRATRAKG
jgi:hypothetical protein